jgi:hypothetical protein
MKLQIDPPRLLPETRSAAAVSEAWGDAPTLLVGEREHRLYVLKPEKIEYIEADGNYVKLHADTTEYISRDTIKRLSNVLNGGFIRIERSLLINIRAVAYAQRVGRRTYAFTLVSGSCLFSSPKYRDEILRALPLTQKPSARSPGIGNSSKTQVDVHASPGPTQAGASEILRKARSSNSRGFDDVCAAGRSRAPHS